MTTLFVNLKIKMTTLLIKFLRVKTNAMATTLLFQLKRLQRIEGCGKALTQ